MQWGLYCGLEVAALLVAPLISLGSLRQRSG